MTHFALSGRNWRIWHSKNCTEVEERKRERLVTYENIQKQRTSEMVKRWNASHIDTEVSQHVQIFIQVQFLLCLFHTNPILETYKRVYHQSYHCGAKEQMGLEGVDIECGLVPISPFCFLYRCHVKAMRKLLRKPNCKKRSKGWEPTIINSTVGIFICFVFF